ncbi:MAG: GNAT family N-acetyltransferase [Hyphomonadaceae bacterium]
MLPAGFDALCAAANAEGFTFLDRLAQRWRAGGYDGDGAASLRCAYADGQLAGVGAQTFDEYDPGPDRRRIRHFYILPQLRRRGAGRTLAGELIADAFALAPRLHLRATHALSTAFWDAMGFARVDHPSRSHELVRP